MALRFLRDYPEATYNDLRLHIVEHCQQGSDMLLLRQRLGSIRCRNNVEGYYREFTETADTIDNLSDAEAVHLFISGLPRNIAGRVTAAAPISLSNAFRLAKAAELEYSLSSGSRPPGSSSSSSRFRDQGRSHRSPEYEPSKSSADRKPTSGCFYCGKPGHKAAECRKKQRDEQGSSHSASSKPSSSSSGSSHGRPRSSHAGSAVGQEVLLLSYPTSPSGKQLKVLVDTGASGCFLSPSVAQELAARRDLSIETIDPVIVKIPGGGQVSVSQVTSPVQLSFHTVSTVVKPPPVRFFVLQCGYDGLLGGAYLYPNTYS